MNDQSSGKLLESMLERLELPDSAYDKARTRYEDLGEWLCREESSCVDSGPHIFPQGSFRFGTAIMPLDEKEPYDLDLACELSNEVAKESHTQQSVKALVGNEIESYRVARGIRSPKEEKHRCWRIEYADQISFHMDIVPCIPEVQSKRQAVREAMTRSGESADLARVVSDLTVSITDDRHPRYRQICDDWNISNPEGYAKWFESRMKLAQQLLQERAGRLKAASVDDLPVYKWKTPLQRVVQLLKRHRDQMFRDDPDSKPISIIITALAAKAYQGESDVDSALQSILARMGTLVNTSKPRIPNPVDPGEDFADRWAMPESRHLNLEENFWNWLKQAQTDFGLLKGSEDPSFLSDQALRKFAVNLSAEDLSRRLGLANPSISAVLPKEHVIPEESAKPWRLGA